MGPETDRPEPVPSSLESPAHQKDALPMRRNALIPYLFVLAGLATPAALAQTPVDTSFTYQGELSLSGTPAAGPFDLRFTLFDAASGGNQIGVVLCSDNLSIVNGRVAVSLDFGAAFAGQKRYLQVEVRPDTGFGCDNASGYTALTPRQELSAAPYASYALQATTATSALTAGNATSLNGQSAGFYQDAANLTGTLSSAQLSGVYSNPLTLTNAGNVFAGDGASIINLNAANISGGVLDAARMPTNWPAGGDLSGFFPAPLIAPGAVTLSKLEPGVQSVLSSLARLTPAPTPLDGIGWGNNTSGRATVPTAPPGLHYVALSAGYGHSLALLSDGSLLAWGFGGDGQLALPTPPAGQIFVAIAAGGYHNLALCSDGSVVAAGRGTNGQTAVPQLPPGVVYTAVAGGLTHSLSPFGATAS
jgi:hypothetical protein